MRDEEIKEILKNSKTIAMIGVSTEKKGEDKKKTSKRSNEIYARFWL